MKNNIIFLILLIFMQANCVEIISLGSNCVIASMLRVQGEHHITYPFDWIVTPLQGLIQAFENDFIHMVVPDYECIHENSLEIVDLYGFKYRHDFPVAGDKNTHINVGQIESHLVYDKVVGNWQDYLEDVKSKYSRRLIRLRTKLSNGSPIIFVRYDNEMGSQESALFMHTIRAKYPQANIVLFVIGGTSEFLEPWGYRDIHNLYIDAKYIGDIWQHEPIQVFFKIIANIVEKKSAMNFIVKKKEKKKNKFYQHCYQDDYYLAKNILNWQKLDLMTNIKRKAAIPVLN